MKKIIVALILAVFAGSAQATPILWTLDDVEFDDGGTATGTFLYDADTDIYSAISVTTTVGTTLPGEFYQFHNPDVFSDADGLLGLTTIANPVGGTPAFNINLESALTNAGGTVVLLTLPPPAAFEGFCFNDPCTGFQGTFRAVTSGTVFAQAVPEPSSALLFPVGLAIWARALRRRS